MRIDSADWELLRITRWTTRQHGDAGRRIHTEHVHEERTRLRVTMHGRMGQSIAWHDGQPMPEQVEQALAAAPLGPHVALPFGASYPAASTAGQADGDELDELVGLPGALRIVRHRRRARFFTAGGATLSWDHTETRVVFGYGYDKSRVPVALFDEAEAKTSLIELIPPVAIVPVTGGRHTLSQPLLCNPLMLSTLLLPQWASALSDNADAIPNCPNRACLVDDGDGAPTDLEGTPRRWVTLLDRDGVVHPVRTLTSARRAEQLTGHGGLVGPELENVTVLPEACLDVPESSAAHVAVDARPLAAAPHLVALTMMADPDPPSTVIASITSPTGLLRHGHWVRPTQRGNGPWRSPWLELPEPHEVLTILHVDDHQ